MSVTPSKKNPVAAPKKAVEKAVSVKQTKPAKAPVAEKIAAPVLKKAAKPAAAERAVPKRKKAIASTPVEKKPAAATSEAPEAPDGKRVKKAVDKKAADKRKSPKASQKSPKASRTTIVRECFFVFPEIDYIKISSFKQRALQSGCKVKKSEILRTGLLALSSLSDQEFMALLESVVAMRDHK